MKRKILILLICLPLSVFAQKGITFQVEELSKPKRLLDLNSSDELSKILILWESYRYPEIEEYKDYPFNIVAKSQLPDSLVEFGYHSFFQGMDAAYADHRPFVLSPDMIWLLISQGFAQHINANPEKMRHHFADFSGKLSLIIKTNEIKLDNPDSNWEKIFPEFTKQIAKHTGKEIINLLSSDFTTTTAIERVAFEITIMEAMKSFFEFKAMYACGIPEITLRGTPKDWQKILDKTKQLKKYDLEWWITELDPVLEEFVNASKGKINKPFWINMYKRHSPYPSEDNYGAPDTIDGWIVKFFPYDIGGNRNNLKNIETGHNEFGGNLPNEIVKVDLEYIDATTGITTPLELWAGFFGLEQNKENFALTPKIGWLIRKKERIERDLVQQFKSYSENIGHIDIRVKEFPIELLSLTEIESLSIEFISEINIPNEFANVKMDYLNLSGQITKSGIERIIKMFPDTRIVINGKIINDKSEK